MLQLQQSKYTGWSRKTAHRAKFNAPSSCNRE